MLLLNTISRLREGSQLPRRFAPLLHVEGEFCLKKPRIKHKRVFLNHQRDLGVIRMCRVDQQVALRWLDE